MITRRRAIVVAVVLFTVIGLSYWSDQRLLADTEELLSQVSGVREAIVRDNWGIAKEQLITFKQSWPDVRRRWDLRINRDEMDDLDLSFARLESFVAEEDRMNSLSELNVLNLLITHIRLKEVFRWRNVL